MRETNNQTVAHLRAALRNAPRSAPCAPDLRGWWLPNGYYVCAPCAARIIARGCALPQKSEAVWKDRPEPYGVCCTCEATDTKQEIPPC